MARLAERLHHVEPFEGLTLTLLRSLGTGFMTERIRKLVEVHPLEQHVNGLGTHKGDELVGVVVRELLVAFGEHRHYVEILFFGEQIQILHTFGHTGLHHYVTLVVYHHLELLGRHAYEVAYLVGQRTEIPYMHYGYHQRYVAGTLPAYLLLGDLHAASVTDYALVADTFVFAAVALVVLDGAEDPLAEEAVALGLVCAIVNGLGLEHFAARSLEDLLGRCQTDPYLGEAATNFVIFFQCHGKLNVFA